MNCVAVASSVELLPSLYAEKAYAALTARPVTFTEAVLAATDWQAVLTVGAAFRFTDA